MIAAAKARGIAVILLTPTPDQDAMLDDPVDPLNQHAGQVRRLAREHDVLLVDSLSAFREKLRSGVQLPDLMSQSNHPNAAGHTLVAAELLKCFP
jgi:lysophospholipase L1-like esterase